MGMRSKFPGDGDGVVSFPYFLICKIEIWAIPTYSGLNSVSIKFMTTWNLRTWHRLEVGPLLVWLLKLKWGHMEFGWALSPTTGAQIRTGEDSQTLSEASNVKTEIRELCYQKPWTTKDFWQLLEASKKAWNRFSLRVPKRTNPPHTSILDIWPPKAVKEHFCITLSHPICGTLLRQS